jgi:hypothetical protein
VGSYYIFTFKTQQLYFRLEQLERAIEEWVQNLCQDKKLFTKLKR